MFKKMSEKAFYGQGFILSSDTEAVAHKGA